MEIRTDNSKVIEQLQRENDELRARVGMLEEVLKTAKGVYTSTNDSSVKKGFAMSGSIKYYRIEPYILHKALQATEQETGDD